MKSIFHGLRGKLTLTYTLVTVLALLALEALAISLVVLAASLNRMDQREYLNDAIYILYPQARDYLQPGKEDLPGLQAWLEGVAASGYASLPPQYAFDSPAAVIVPEDPLLVVSPDLTVLAQAPLEPNSLVGRRYTSGGNPGAADILTTALDNWTNPLDLSTQTAEGNIRLAVPIRQADRSSPVVGVLLLTIEPAPPMILNTLPVYLGWIAVTGLLLLMAVAPFGALFGYIMARGLTRRLTALSQAADAWSEGDFQPLPVDRSNDEIGALGRRLRHMAEHIQNLLHTQQELAILEERNRLARDLHDTVKQQSFATYMQIRAARNLLASDPAAAEKHLVEAEGLIKTSQQELNLLITELRPAGLEDQGLTGALRNYLKTWYEHTRIPVTLQVTGERRLPLAVEQVLYRVAQEALANVARHSRASAATLQLDITEEQARLEIADNGVGFDPQEVSGQGFGLESMKTRTAELGGQVTVNSARDQGTQVTVCAPLLPQRQVMHGNGKD